MASLSKIVLPSLIAVLTFSAVAPLVAQTLTDSEWAPVDNADTATQASGEAFIRFEQDSVLVGNGCCNSFRGRFVPNGDAILFGPTAATMMLCEESVSAAKTGLFQSLGAARTFMSDDTELGLSDADGNAVMRLIQRNAN